MNIACPKCGFEEPESARECSRCGIVFGKFVEDSRPRPSGLAAAAVLPDDDDDEVADGRVGPDELKVLGIGLALAIVVYVIPITHSVFATIKTLFHELGHAVVGWLLGHPAIPAFDFVYGGGVTHMQNFQLSLALVIAAGFAYLLWIFRQNRTTVALIAGFFLVWLFFVSSEWRREIAFASAGVLFEFILAGIFFYQALAGVGWRNPEVERPLGAFVAFFVQIYSMGFAWRLSHSSEILEQYKEGKAGGALMNDLDIIALDLHIHTPFNPGIVGLAQLLFVFSFVPIAVALLWYFQRARWHRVLRALRTASA